MMIIFIYSTVLTLIAPFFLFFLLKKKKGRPTYGPRWKELFGVTPALSNSSSKSLWFHAVSVGETIAITPLIRRIKQFNPELNIVFTTTTPTGAKQAEKLAGLVEHRYMPIDFAIFVRRFINTVRPEKLIIVETELWPNMLREVSKSGIPIFVINARMSEKSCNGYRKVQPLFDIISESITKFQCVHEDDQKRFHKLGVDESKLEVVGSIKFDIPISERIIYYASNLRREIGVDRPIWIAASTHEGEDQIILDVHKDLVKEFPNALLMVVPRHPERFVDVATLSQKLFNTITRTSGRYPQRDDLVYIGDTMGELLTLIGASDVCFMGGSLLGKKVGGHNLLEPAAMGKPTLIGPSYYNFKDITIQLNAVNSCKIVESHHDILNEVLYLFRNKKEAATKGELAKDVVKKNRGSIERNIRSLGIIE
ncbi:lipid IV(A) 3-deoxy-D-manno-octulosonic acid transferase [Vibrio profundum]|uniref:lipid IV(A) 3-deoxy-D-manno-octulosonic acid transferase n=1 Tax=Vibrio profundum TaxID=2910247 RepID=UPI003D0F2AD3